LAPENSARRLTIHRANMLTRRVITNSTRPVKISTFTPFPEASGNFSAMFAAMFCCWPALRMKIEYSRPG
jgi:hypothetical protein